MESFIVKPAMATAMNRLPRRFGESAKFGRIASHRAGFLRVFPRGFRQRHGARRRLQRLAVGRGTVANASRNALGDAGETAQIVGKIPVEDRTGTPCDGAVDRRGLFPALN